LTVNAESAAQGTIALYLNGETAAYPVDPVGVARSLGINVFQAPLTNTLSGMIAKVSADAGTDIVVNSEHAPVRQRFTVAHELGHYVALTSDPERASMPFIHRRDTLSACGTDSEEIFANQFAAELLMPRAEVLNSRRMGLDLYRLAARFHVSVDAMSYRLKNLPS
jgi:Zn-dependent peptidase ImmA (M78 family)